MSDEAAKFKQQDGGGEMAWWTRKKAKALATQAGATVAQAPLVPTTEKGVYRDKDGRRVRLVLFHDCIFRIASDDPASFKFLRPGQEALLKGISPAIGTEGDGEVVLRINGDVAYSASRAALEDLSKRLGVLDQAGAAMKEMMAAVNGVREKIAAREKEGATDDALAALEATEAALSALVTAWGAPTALEKLHYLDSERTVTLACEYPNGGAAPGRVALDLRMLVGEPVHESKPGATAPSESP